MSGLRNLVGRWAFPLSELERGNHLNYVINTLNPVYDNNVIVCPTRVNVFKAFRMLQPEDLKVVILGMDPYSDPTKCTGYAFANPEETLNISPSLQKIHETVEKTVKNDLYLDFDITLEKWVSQGILAINSAFTVEQGRPGSHLHIWRRFTETLIMELSRNFNELFFCFWGKQAQQFAYLIDETKHTVLICYHPAYVVRRGTYWECDHFQKINEKLEPKIDW